MTIENPFNRDKVENIEDRIRSGVMKALEDCVLPDFVKEITYECLDPKSIHRLDHLLVIEYTKDLDQCNRHQKDVFIKQLYKKLEANHLELDFYRENNGRSEEWTLAETVINGATNWRRWLHYPEKFSEEIKMYLDEIAQQVGQQKGFDGYQKFLSFLEEAKMRGLLSAQEVKTISNQIHRVANA